MEAFYSSDEDFAWGPLTVREMKRDLLRPRRPPRHRITVHKIELKANTPESKYDSIIVLSSDSEGDNEEAYNTHTSRHLKEFQNTEESIIVLDTSSDSISPLKFEDLSIIEQTEEANISTVSLEEMKLNIIDKPQSEDNCDKSCEHSINTSKLNLDGTHVSDEDVEIGYFEQKAASVSLNETDSVAKAKRDNCYRSELDSEDIEHDIPGQYVDDSILSEYNSSCINNGKSNVAETSYCRSYNNVQDESCKRIIGDKNKHENVFVTRAERDNCDFSKPDSGNIVHDEGVEIGYFGQKVASVSLNENDSVAKAERDNGYCSKVDSEDIEYNTPGQYVDDSILSGYNSFCINNQKSNEAETSYPRSYKTMQDESCKRVVVPPPSVFNASTDDESSFDESGIYGYPLRPEDLDTTSEEDSPLKQSPEEVSRKQETGKIATNIKNTVTKTTPQNQFRTPQTQSKMKSKVLVSSSNKYKDIKSPISLYIQGSGTSPLIRKVHPSPMRQLSPVVATSSRKDKLQADNIELPKAVYKPPKKRMVTVVKEHTFMPPSIAKHVHNPKVIKHEKRLNLKDISNIDAQLEMGEITSDSLLDASNASVNMSVLTIKRRF